MAGIRSRHTKPERTIRSELHKRGFRFGLHRKDLKGTPDLVMPKYRAVIFVHGCFWHGHDCELFKMPSTRTGFWKTKFQHNQDNDAIAHATLLQGRWRVLTVWECALRGRSEKQVTALIDTIARWLHSSRRSLELPAARYKAS
jgi:DNA mismatch endonuclease (patch repair protein)